MLLPPGMGAGCQDSWQRRRRVQCRRFMSHCNNREEFNAIVSDVLQLYEKGRVSGRKFKWLRGKFKWLRGLLAAAEAGSAAVGSNKSSRSGLGSPALMLRLLLRRVCRGRGYRRGGLGVAATAVVDPL
ncbi:hypothetical protein BHE74_00027569 [Ensete ventricosum]|nr:hypothetical protein BHE74_00027569 [Ensete ventricosum]